MNASSIIEVLKKYNQTKLLNYFKSLSDDLREKLIANLKKIDLNYFFKEVYPYQFKKKDPGKISPEKVITLNEIQDNTQYCQEVIKKGISVLKSGVVAFLVVAGGQGSRLGFDHPKGLFPIGPITGKSLFQIFFEKIKAASQNYNFKPMFLIMTSESNDTETKEFIKSNKFFGLKEDEVIFFKQGMLPAVDFQGNLILEDKTSLFLAPDGHGGTLYALIKSGIYDELEKRGYKYLSYFQVDNPLVKPADPFFIGLHILNESEFSTKVVKKRDWNEKVGVAAKVNGKPAIVEYIDLSEEMAKMTYPDGNLVYGFGNIAIHLINLDFVKRLKNANLSLPFHIAKKKIPFYDYERKIYVKPEKPNGIKFERFIFDSIPLAEKAIFVETLREEEFAPLKNKEGNDSIATCKKAISDFYKNWFRSAGFKIISEKSVYEVSPLFAYEKNIFKLKIKDYIKNLPEKLYIE